MNIRGREAVDEQAEHFTVRIHDPLMLALLAGAAHLGPRSIRGAQMKGFSFESR